MVRTIEKQNKMVAILFLYHWKTTSKPLVFQCVGYSKDRYSSPTVFYEIMSTCQKTNYY